MSITIIGLGPGDAGMITRQAWDVLEGTDVVYLRTKVHPTVKDLPKNTEYQSFDDLYEKAERFEDVYDGLVAELVKKAQAGEDVVYAVPGDPMVAEGTVTRLFSVCEEKNIDVHIINGVSFIEPTLAALSVDAIPGLQLVDAIDVANVYHPPISPDYPALIAQVYARDLASDVKLTLMNEYPDEHRVMLVHGAGTEDEEVLEVALYEIDRGESAHLTSLYVPPIEKAVGTITGFEGFQNTIARLRSPEGCPWDREQTHQTLRNNLLEETYEVIDAIDAEDADMLVEELGDLLLQVVLHAQIAIDDGEFYMNEVIQKIDEKLKRRHPHVWGDVDVNGDAVQVVKNWEEIKAQEREENGEAKKSTLDGVSMAMPALAMAHQYDHRAARLGFDWPEEKQVVEKVYEELDEVKSAKTEDEQFHEIGDLLLVVAVWARWKGINPEDALRAANRRFYDRFTYIEKMSREQGRKVSDLTLDEMNDLWDERKEQQAK